MKKKGFLFSVLISFLFLISLAFVSAEVTGCDDDDVDCKVSAAYTCLDGQVSDRGGCAALSPEEAVFNFMATGECEAEVLNDPRYLQDLKFTSEVFLALESLNMDSDFARDWLLTQERASVGLDWFLEIDSPTATTCTVDSLNVNTVVINEDKEITSLTGSSCLTLDSAGYWMKITPSCYDRNFTVSCDSGFISTLLYQVPNSETIYVSEKTSSGSAGGITIERINSLCFGAGSSCDYEESLWAILALSIAGEETKNYLQYLTASAENNQNLLPSAFLYFITGKTEYKNELLSKQINSKWWTYLGDRYYGTALALYFLRFEESQEKSDAIDWLLSEAQNGDGCWDSGNVRNTAFLLASVFPDGSPGSGGGGTGGGGSLINGSTGGGVNDVECTSAGYFCSSMINCVGAILSEYSCSTGTYVCCSQETQLETCSEQSGDICSQSQNCVGIGSVEVQASDLFSGELCCFSGSCQTPSPGSGGGTGEGTCESSGGECRINGCLSGEDEAFSFSCDFSSDDCCLPSNGEEPGGSANWAWVFAILILIVLVILGIVFRDKLRVLLFRIKSKFKKGKPSGFSRMPPRRAVSRRPLSRRSLPGRTPPLNMKPPVGKTPASRTKGELDDVLKKLKKIGK